MMYKQRKHRIMLKYQSNIASKPATGMQGYTVTKKAFNVTESRRVEVVGALRDLSNLKITGHALSVKVILQKL